MLLHFVVFDLLSIVNKYKVLVQKGMHSKLHIVEHNGTYMLNWGIYQLYGVYMFLLKIYLKNIYSVGAAYARLHPFFKSWLRF